ncbi:11652_t:CDS:2 [Ambispora leptoticha]|uniref:11652_t:CDS:1 n=1 Tax=Ambispora leptoticha TaxID=144679 RepID=A0A9N9CW85_9GLOM|nr:11652_t:CDS:2 [Ambispora leptoticha]
MSSGEYIAKLAPGANVPPPVQLSNDLVARVVHDHKFIEKLYRDFEDAASEQDCQNIANAIIREIGSHANVEEIVVIPAYEKYINPDGNKYAEKARQKALAVKNSIYELRGLKMGEKGFQAKLFDIMSTFRDHTGIEEQESFPKLKECVDTEVLNELGHAWNEAKEKFEKR